MKKGFFLLTLVVSAYSFAQQKSDILLGTQYVLHSNNLGQDRKINVRLPENYSDTISYPVIFLLDGSTDGDFLPFCGLAHNAAYPWINQLPASIIVGIENIDRRHDFTFPTTVKEDLENYPTTGHSKEFIAFLKTELIPWTESHFKTSERTIAGQSLGGLLVSEILLSDPGLFNMYILVSPSLWWDKESILSRPAGPAISNKQVFIVYGEEGDLMEKPAQNLVKSLRQTMNGGYLFTQKIATTNHANIFIPAFQLAFEKMDWFFGRK